MRNIFFPENALKSLTIDVIEQLQAAATTLGSVVTSKDEKLEALERIFTYVDDIDTAIDFCKIGGTFVLIPCLNSQNTEIQSQTALLVAEIAQNNPYCQNVLIETDLLPVLLRLLSEKETAECSLRAISCLIRNNDHNVMKFVELDGLISLIGCFQQGQQEKLWTRAAFLVNSLCQHSAEIRSDLIKNNAIEFIISLIRPQAEYNTCLETMLLALCSLTDGDTSNITRFQNFKQTLDDIMKQTNGKEECKEIIEYCEKLLKYY